ncbi:heavy metal-associated isoprenylated plant protein 3-like [Papaver somniferum]|uniref:heavy metal-associated isoprenylated plant protein 3-like n=1 Tax=Papaver somniferum TaxID=3469 RepID=UPI000E6F9945|nr:heavy metal-associated isoprenylated plant protein 3-like [Papaver somniferum]
MQDQKDKVRDNGLALQSPFLIMLYGTLKNSYILIKKRRKIRRKLPDKGEKIIKDENEKQEDDGVEMVTIVLNVSKRCQCIGCVKEVIKSIQSFEGVEKTERDSATNEITVIGKRVDPVKLREYVALKTKKKVELISPFPKKPEKETPKEKKVIKKQAPQVMSTVIPPQVMSNVILKIDLHCADCINETEKFMTTYEGVDSDSFRVDEANNFVKVKGTMDVTELITSLKQILKRDVHIVRRRKEMSGNRKMVMR